MRHAVLVLLLAGIGAFAHAADLPIFDAHLHYSHDAWEQLSAKEAVAAPAQGRRAAGDGVELGRRGPQRLYAARRPT